MNNYYVYFHMDGDEVVYVGKGTGDRAYRTGNRGVKEHSDFLNDKFNNGITDHVEIIEWNLSEEEAFKMETKLLKQGDYRFNRTHTEEWYNRLREQSKEQAKRRCKPVTTPLGHFDSITEAAEAHSIKRSTATKYLKEGKWNYESV